MKGAKIILAVITICIVVLMVGCSTQKTRAAPPISAQTAANVPVTQESEAQESAASQENTEVQAITLSESDKDPFGFYETVRQYQMVMDAGAKILIYPEDQDTFGVLWIPEHPSGRILVLLHGTSGTPYPAVAEQLDLAKEYNITLFGVLWQDYKTHEYFPADQIYSVIDEGLQYINATYNMSPDKVALEGFSRGSAMSFETTYIDLAEKHYFDYVIAFSGGIAEDSLLEPKSSDVPYSFFEDLQSGKLGDQVFAGTHFFLYCGMKDENWGTTMCDKMDNSQKWIEATGGEVVELVKDPNGVHRGLVLNEEYHRDSYEWFVDLTSDE